MAGLLRRKRDEPDDRDEKGSDKRLTRKRDERMGELLRQEGLLNDEQIAAALARQEAENQLFGEALIGLSYVTERDVARVISKQYSLPFIDVQSHLLTKDVIESVPPTVLGKYQVIPLDRIGNTMTFATSGPLCDEMVRELELLCNCDVQLFIGTVSGVQGAINTFYEMLNENDPVTNNDGELRQAPTEHSGQE